MPNPATRLGPWDVGFLGSCHLLLTKRTLFFFSKPLGNLALGPSVLTQIKALPMFFPRPKRCSPCAISSFFSPKGQAFRPVSHAHGLAPLAPPPLAPLARFDSLAPLRADGSLGARWPRANMGSHFGVMLEPILVVGLVDVLCYDLGFEPQPNGYPLNLWRVLDLLVAI